MTKEEFEDLVKDSSRELTIKEYSDARCYVHSLLPIIKYGDEYSKLIKSIENTKTPIKTKIKARKQWFRSRDNWYDSFYAIGNTFTDEEIDSFSDETIDLLIRLGDKMSDYLY